MDILPPTSSPARTAGLTKVAPFALGTMAVVPPARTIAVGERSEMLEPRVMRVLIALGENPGRVLSRDELIEQCWDGHIVGDKAITRAISLLRHAIDQLGANGLHIETIAKVGFRLVVDAPPGAGEASGALRASDAGPIAAVQAEAAPDLRRIWTRRAAWIGLAAGAAGTASFAWLLSRAHHIPDPRAVELFKQAQQSQKNWVFETKGEAIGLYKQAVAIDPRYADAWGALALSYSYWFGAPLSPGDSEAVSAAARRALALDPTNADARLALILLYPFYRHWQEREAQLRAFLRDRPDSVVGHVWLGWLLIEVGRSEDAVTVAEQAFAIDPAPKGVRFLRAFACYFAGRDSQGHIAWEELRLRWPQDLFVYSDGYYWLLQNRRYKEARAYAADTGRRPHAIRPEMAETWMRKAEALASGRGIAEFQNRPRVVPTTMQLEGAPYLVTDLALVGKVDELFALLEASFFGGEYNGTRVPPPGPLDRRYSMMLFFPALAGLRGDSRYASLLRRTGLEDYWRKSGTQPDFRRG